MKYTYSLDIWILSASFVRPKSCQGRDRVDGWLPIDVVGLLWLPCKLTRCMLFTETGIEPFASSSVAGWQSSV